MQLANMITQQYSVDLVTELWKAVDNYDEETLNCFFVEVVNAFIRYSLRLYWAQYP